MRLHNYKLALPAFKLKDWNAAVESTSGAMQEILRAQADGLKQLETIREPMASTERVGWLNLWSKTFAVLEAVAAALMHQSKLVLILSWRNSFELMLQTHAVIDPLRKLNLKNKSSGGAATGTGLNANKEYAYRACVDRLRAYTAWCLWHDKAYFTEILNPRSMRDIWSVGLDGEDDTHKALKSSTRFISLLENEGGVFDDNFLHEGSRRTRTLYTDKIRQIDEWLADPLLCKWADNIEKASQNNPTGVPFYMLFDRSDVSIPKRLLREGIRFTYSTYINSSMASHGSSMEEFIQVDAKTIKPLLKGDKDQLNILAPEVIFRCQHIYTILGILNKEMLKNPHIRT
jgi:hypothetical protein